MSVTARAIWYIESHLSEGLSLDVIAEAVGVSRFHLSRAFNVTVQTSLAQYVRARRLNRAAHALAAGAPDILTVALDSGYGSHEAFTRAFRQQFGVVPEHVRQQGHLKGVDLMDPIRIPTTTTATLVPPRVVHSGAILIFGLSERHEGSNARIPSQWDRFVPHLGHLEHQVGTDTFGVICNTDDAGTIEYICGVQVSEFPSQPREFARLRIPPQDYAVFQHRDHVSSVSETWKAIWNHGLSDAGLEAADGPTLERYGSSFDGRTGAGGFEIWVPIQRQPTSRFA
jgi:AraC family transcriptional regulator